MKRQTTTALRGIIAWLLLAVVAAGCLGSGPDSNPPDLECGVDETSGPCETPLAKPRALTMDGCEFLQATGYAPEDRIAQSLPPEYRPRANAVAPGQQVPAAAGIQVTAMRCDQSTNERNDTWPNPKWVLVEAVVDPPTQADKSEDFDFFVVAAYTSDENAAKAFARDDYVVTHAEISWTDGPTGAAVVVRTGTTTAFELRVGPSPAGDSPEIPFAGRLHQFPNSTHRWLDMTYTEIVAQRTFSDAHATAAAGPFRDWYEPATEQVLAATRTRATDTVSLTAGPM